MGNKTFLRYSFLTFLLTMIFTLRLSAQVNPYDIRPFNNKYVASHTEIPESLVPIDASYISSAYQWESSTRPTDSFVAITGATSATYTFPAPLAQTTYFRRKFRIGRVEQVYSNIIKIEVVSVNWEDVNYLREHTLQIPGHSDWKVIDELAIGPKMQTTSYFDGLDRTIQVVAREIGSPIGSSTWRDLVEFSKFDAIGRQNKMYYPYSTSNQQGKFKTNAESEQLNYYSTNFGQLDPYSRPTYENNPLSRVANLKRAGTSWSTGNGQARDYQLNELADDVQMFAIGYGVGDAPVRVGTFPASSLFKDVQTDENGKKIIIYTDFAGKEILIKQQVSDVPTEAHDGWICTYNIYDEFGLIRYRIQPEGVAWLSNHLWSFTDANGQKILDEQCYRYEYNSKKELILMKAPGAAYKSMLYDRRGRLVYMQDGNQRAKSPSEWTVTIYDELDRAVVTFLYLTTKSISTLQSELDAANGSSNLMITELSLTVSTSNNPISSIDINNNTITTVLGVNFYDDYSYPGVKPFSNLFDNHLAYPTGGEPITPSARALSMPTGTLSRVLGSTNFLLATSYYDEKNRIVQRIDDNILSGVDVSTNQYGWDGRKMSSSTHHSAAASAFTGFSVVSKYLFDNIGRIVGIQKKYGSNGFSPLVSLDFDDLGRLKTKRLAPEYTGSGSNELESLTYSYNLHGSLTGINKEYALKTPGLYSKWGHFFGVYMGYENLDNTFTSGRLDGRLTGILWNTQGDDAQRKFEFAYDPAGRLTKAVFHEKKSISDSWNNNTMDFSSIGSSSSIMYDLNGNLTSLQHKGVVVGSPNPILVDDLHYTYATLSNRLVRVTDNTPATAYNGKFGDFQDGPNGSSDDYVYDAMGNLTVDLNKDVKELSGVGSNGVKYNYLAKPEEINIAGKGRIKIIYDATGKKLQMQFIPEGSSTAQTISYVDQFVYVGTEVQSVLFEEGRIRVLNNVSENNGLDFRTLDGTIDLPGGKRGAFDYFIRDYQSNVRMILTIESHIGGNTCTMEVDRASNEEPLFGQVDASGDPTVANEVAARFPTTSIPGSGWADNTSAYVSRVGASAASKVGPNSLMKVMAGDKISATAQYYYPDVVTNSTGTSILSELLGSLVQAISSGGVTGGVTKSAAGNIGTLLNASTPMASATSPDANNATGTAPKAYLTLLFFDERFNFVEEGSQTLRVSQAGNGADPLTMLNIKAPKNGYAYVYVSNESNEHVYFDNLQVSHNRGHILEENHYYAYGLKIEPLSSRKIQDVSEGGVMNNNLYNDKELIVDGDLDWYDYGFRMYDQQLGRFFQLDPLTNDYPYLTPYQYASCDPIDYIDIDGLEGAPATSLSTTIKNSITLSTVVVSNARRVYFPISSLQAAFRTGAVGALNIAMAAEMNRMPRMESTYQRGNLYIEQTQAQMQLPVVEQAYFEPSWSSQYNDDYRARLQKYTDIYTELKYGLKADGSKTLWKEFQDSRFNNSVLQPMVTIGELMTLTYYGRRFVVQGVRAFSAEAKVATVTANRAAGNQFRDELAEALRAEGRDAVTEVYKWTPFGARYIDIEVRVGGIPLGGIEAKVGGSRYLPLQRLKDLWLHAVKDYPVNLVRKPSSW